MDTDLAESRPPPPRPREEVDERRLAAAGGGDAEGQGSERQEISEPIGPSRAGSGRCKNPLFCCSDSGVWLRRRGKKQR
uniref:Uncharacterized protein n=1 Tax=Arundo donax TaxID=35708 RepID=A0A0A9F4U5_ARUDO